MLEGTSSSATAERVAVTTITLSSSAMAWTISGASAQAGKAAASATSESELRKQCSNMMTPSTRPLPAGSMRFVQRSEEHTSELQSLMRISYAVFCLKNKKTKKH